MPPLISTPIFASPAASWPSEWTAFVIEPSSSSCLSDSGTPNLWTQMTAHKVVDATCTTETFRAGTPATNDGTFSVSSPITLACARVAHALSISPTLPGTTIAPSNSNSFFDLSVPSR